jgi:transposase-like protein
MKINQVKQAKYTKKDFNKMFPDNDSCIEWLKNHLYPDGIFCPTCKKVTPHHKLHGRPVYACEVCRHQVSPLANTIFHKSATPLKLWFEAIFEMSTTKTGYSAKCLQRSTGVTYKTAWRMFKQIRSMLDENTGKFSGKVEADETYIGGARHGTRGRGADGKTIVAGVVERQASVSASVVPDVKANTLIPMIQDKVSPDATVFTDEMPSYAKLDKIGFEHRVINHLSKSYVNGDIHTNTIEGFWSLVKRGISGTYHHVSPEYLQSYVNEYSFRYNHRKDEKPMFQSFLNRIH